MFDEINIAQLRKECNLQKFMQKNSPTGWLGSLKGESYFLALAI
jgi:hypothetical protein